MISTLWNETGAACLHDFIESLSHLNSIGFVKRIIWKSGDVEIRPRSGRSRRKCQEYNVFLLAEFQKLGFRQIWMCLDLDHGWLDSRGFVDGQQSFKLMSDSPMARKVSSKVTPRS